MSYTPGYVTPLTAMNADDVDLVEAFSTYQASRALAAATVNRRRWSLVRFARHMAPASITTATAADVDDFTAKHRAAATKHAYRSDLATFYGWALRRGLVTSNPVALTDSVRRPKPLPKPASPEAITAVFTIASADLQLAILLGALAGLRVSEIAGLDATNVHLDAEPPVLIVRETKWGRDRIVPLHPRLRSMLAGQTGWYFPNGHGGHISGQYLSARINRVVARAGVERWTMHGLRHYFATEAARWSGGDVILVSSLLGHASVNTTMAYVRPHVAHGAEVIAKIAAGQVDDELAARRARAG